MSFKWLIENICNFVKFIYENNWCYQGIQLLYLFVVGEIDSLIVCSYMRDFLVKTLFNSHQLNMMGPCSVKVDGTYTSITQDDIHYLSQYAVTIATGLVTLHFGQEHALCLKMFVDHCLQFYKVLYIYCYQYVYIFRAMIQGFQLSTCGQF